MDLLRVKRWEKSLGFTDGLLEGVALGEDLGLRNGLAEGEALGEELGSYRDGLLEGVALGEELGLTDGLAESEELGEELGLADRHGEGVPRSNNLVLCTNFCHRNSPWGLFFFRLLATGHRFSR